jgi:hypothetical protein
MIGSLLEVFEIAGRGCIILVDIESGNIRVGDSLTIGDRTWPVTGIEMVNYGAEGRRRLSEGWTPPIGILLGDAEKADLVEVIGERVSSVPTMVARA